MTLWKDFTEFILCFPGNLLSTACVHVWHENYSSGQQTCVLCDRSGKRRAQSWTCTGCGLQAWSKPGNTEHLMDTNDQGSSRQIVYKPSGLRTVNLKQHMAVASYKSNCSGLGTLSVASGPCNCQLYSQIASKVDSSAKISRGKWRPRGLCTSRSCQLHEEGVPNTFLKCFSHSHVDEVQGFKNTLMSDETLFICIGFIKTVLGITFSIRSMFEIKTTISVYPWPNLWSIISLLSIDVKQVRRDSYRKINKGLNRVKAVVNIKRKFT